MKFATFGCWNNSNNTNTNTKLPYFNYVIDTFNQVDNNSTDFVVVTGDNYYPEKIKNVVALSGYIVRDIFPDDLETKDYTNLDFYCSHGSVDQVIPVDWARQTPAFLSSLHIKNQYSEFPVGHGVAPQNFHELKDWLDKRI